MSSSEVSGVDLARVALRAAMAAARTNGVGKKTKAVPRPARTVRRDGREPMGLAAAFGALATERGWQLPAAGASLCERWAAFAPELAGHVTATGFDADSGQLTLLPESPAWAAKVRLEQRRVIEAANTAAGHPLVRTLRILPPGAALTPELADTVQVPAAPSTPAARRSAPEGYRQAIEAHRQAAPRLHVDPAIAEAVERQSRLMRDLSRRAFPEPDTNRDERVAPIDATLAQRRRDAEVVRQQALHRARAERAGLVQLPARAASGPQPLEQTG